MQSYPLHTHNVVLFLVSSWKQTFGIVESYQWQIGLERILILPLAPCGFDTPYLSLPPLEIATMIPCIWGLSRGNMQLPDQINKRMRGGMQIFVKTLPPRHLS